MKVQVTIHHVSKIDGTDQMFAQVFNSRQEAQTFLRECVEMYETFKTEIEYLD